MVTVVDLAPPPTVHISLAVPIALERGGWTWGELPRLAGVLAREYVYNADECAAVTTTYGMMLSRMIRTCEADRFCVTVRGRVTGALIRRAEWSWDDHAHEFAPSGEPLDGWRAAARAYWDATGQLIGNQRFEARRGRQGTPVGASRGTYHCSPLARAA